MKKIVTIILILVTCSSGSHAQKIKKQMLAAKEPGDSNFVQFANGERKAMKSMKKKNEKWRIKFKDGSEFTCAEDSVVAYQEDDAYYAQVNVNGIQSRTFFGRGMWYAYRVEKGPISLYHVPYKYYDKQIPVTDVEFMMVPAPGVFIHLRNDRAIVDQVEQYVKKSPSAMAEINDIKSDYGKLTTNYMYGRLEKVARLYNKDAAEGKLTK